MSNLSTTISNATTISNSNKGNTAMSMSQSTTISNPINKGNTMQIQVKDTVFSLYESLMTSFMYKLNHDKDICHDVVTDGLLHAIAKIDKFDSNLSSLKTWVSNVAWRLFLDKRRSYYNKNVSCHYDTALFDILASDDIDDITVEITEDDFWGLVSDIVNEKEYGCLVRRFRDDMSYTDIAEHMGIPKGSVMSNLNGAKNKLASNPTFARLFNNSK